MSDRFAVPAPARAYPSMAAEFATLPFRVRLRRTLLILHALASTLSDKGEPADRAALLARVGLHLGVPESTMRFALTAGTVRGVLLVTEDDRVWYTPGAAAHIAECLDEDAFDADAA